MKLLIIGYTGFVGTALYEHFSSIPDYNVKGVNRKNYKEVVGEYFDIIINADGNSKKFLADKDPILDFEMNDLTLLRTLHDFKFEVYILISSIDVYHNLREISLNHENVNIDVSKISNYGFDKYIAELLVKHYAKTWLILRLGGMVGKKLKKGPIYDILWGEKLWVSPKSKFLVMHTQDVALYVQKIIEKKLWNEIFNVTACEPISLEEIIERVGKKEIFKKFYSMNLPIYEYRINVEKISRFVFKPRSSCHYLEKFLREVGY